MKTNKQIKFWLSTFVIGLMAVGGLASYLANQNTLYKGMEPLKENVAMASVLDASADTLPAYQIEVTNERAQAEALYALSGFMDKGSEVLKATKEKIAKSLVEISKAPESAEKIKIPRPEILPAATTYTAQDFSCAPNDTPIVQDSKVVGCVLSDPSALYCESQGRYTYTGNEHQGIQYGMCLDCQTAEFIKNGYKCL